MKFAWLRSQAEERLRTTRREVEAMPVKDVQQLVYELQVHQIELEMQNDELRRTQLELETTRDRYLDLYDFSPAGHLTLDTRGRIVEANLRAGMLLGVNRIGLIGQLLSHFVTAEDQDTFYRHCQQVVKQGTRQACEVHVRQGNGASECLYLESMAVHEEPGRITHWRTALLDISDRKRAEQELMAQQTQLKAIVASAMDAIITVDDRERVIVFNRAAESMFLCRATDAIGQSLDRFIPERFRQAHQGNPDTFNLTAAAPIRSTDRVASLFGLRANGKEFPLEASVSHVRVHDKTLFTVILRDITERRAAEKALQRSDAFTRAILNSLSAQVCVVDKDGLIVKTNDAWKAFARTNLNPAVAGIDVGQNYLIACRRAGESGESAAMVILEGVEAVLGGREPSFSTEYPSHSSEEQCWLVIRVTPLKESEGVVISRTDITERIQMARALERHVQMLADKRAELEFLTGRLIQAQEEERQRIARELHDDFNQRLAALSVDIEMLEQAKNDAFQPVAQQLGEVRATVGQLSNDLHDLAYKLHPSLLEHVGLEVAIRDHVIEFIKKTKLAVTFTSRGVTDGLSREVATNLFRVMQESLQNVFKHAHSTSVSVRLSSSLHGIGLSIEDNGQGLDLETKDVRAKGLGLVSMHERARLLGGVLNIQSYPMGGTKVCVWIPGSRDGA